MQIAFAFSPIATPDGPGRFWLCVWRDARDGRRYAEDRRGDFHHVMADAAGNWCAIFAESPLIFTRTGFVLELIDQIREAA
jgi:hypothetical protein